MRAMRWGVFLGNGEGTRHGCLAEQMFGEHLHWQRRGDKKEWLRPAGGKGIHIISGKIIIGLIQDFCL